MDKQRSNEIKLRKKQAQTMLRILRIFSLEFFRFQLENS